MSTSSPRFADAADMIERLGELITNADRAYSRMWTKLTSERDDAIAEAARLRAALEQALADKAWDALDQAVRPIVAAELDRQGGEDAPRSAFDLKAALVDGGSAEISYHAEQPGLCDEDGDTVHDPEPARYVATVVDSDGFEIGYGSSTTSPVDALSRISDAKMIDEIRSGND
jgi:hypothetical protein